MSNINEISIVFPCDESRVPLLLNTLSRYQQLGVPPNVELVLVSRTFKEFVLPGWDITVVHYKHEGKFFCPSLAYNLGVLEAKYDNILIGHPEVRPVTNVLSQFYASPRGNYVCQAYDASPSGEVAGMLFGSEYRAEWPGLYFLAVYRREDIFAINGWDMRFMQGYSNEDIDFGQRLVNAGIPWSIRDDIIGLHQYHERGNCSEDNEGWRINRRFYEENRDNKVTAAVNGLQEVLIGE